MMTIHFADVHLGTELYGLCDPETGINTRVLDFLESMDILVNTAKKEQVGLVLFAGDAFKSRTPNPTHVYQFALRIKELASVAPVVMVVGNHDYVGYGRISPIKIFGKMSDNVHVLDDVASYVDFSGVRVVALPWLPGIRKCDVVEIANMLNNVLDSTPEDYVRILLTHCSIEGAACGSEHIVMFGRDTTYPLELFDGFDYVAAGHIHKHQSLRIGNTCIVYPGSLERLDFGEEQDSKGFVLVDIKRGGCAWDFVDVDAVPLITLKVDKWPMRHKDIKNVAGAIVRVVIRGGVNVSTEELAETLTKAGVYNIASIMSETYHSSRTIRLDNERTEELDTLDLLRLYFENVGLSESRIKILLECAGRIVSNEL